MRATIIRKRTNTVTPTTVTIKPKSSVSTGLFVVVGPGVGGLVGSGVIGANVGASFVGNIVGVCVGDVVGSLVGVLVGVGVGASVGDNMGALDGVCVGDIVGASVGDAVGAPDRERVGEPVGATVGVTGRIEQEGESYRWHLPVWPSQQCVDELHVGPEDMHVPLEHVSSPLHREKSVQNSLKLPVVGQLLLYLKKQTSPALSIVDCTSKGSNNSVFLSSCMAVLYNQVRVVESVIGPITKPKGYVPRQTESGCFPLYISGIRTLGGRNALPAGIDSHDLSVSF